jgi:hypothetical protein
VAALRGHAPKLRGAPATLPFIWYATTLRNGSNFTLTTDLGDIDLIGKILGSGSYSDAIDQTVEIAAHGYSLRVLTLDALIKSKRCAGRRKDLLILPELEALRAATEKL